MIFVRGTATSVQITITADEALGILDTQRVEDFYGVDGQMTIYHVATTQEFPVTMNNVSGGAFNQFQGQLPLAPMPDGDYEVRGRVVDILGNYSVITAFQSPLGTETMRMLTFSIIASQIYCFEMSVSDDVLCMISSDEYLNMAPAKEELCMTVADC